MNKAEKLLNSHRCNECAVRDGALFILMSIDNDSAEQRAWIASYARPLQKQFACKIAKMTFAFEVAKLVKIDGDDLLALWGQPSFEELICGKQ